MLPDYVGFPTVYRKICCRNFTARQCEPLRRKFMECSINNPALSLLRKHLVIGQRKKAPNFSAFHWSPHSSLVSIGQNFVTTSVVHLPKKTETSLITESDQRGSNHQLLQLCTTRTAWSDSDQAGWLCIAALAVFLCYLNRLRIKSTVSATSTC